MSNKNNCRCGNYGALRSLDRSGTVSGRWADRNSLNTRSACSNCGCGGCRAEADCTECTACSGSRLFYTGCCGAQSGECGCCGQCCQNKNCWDCSVCAEAAAAAEFVVVAPESQLAGGALTFRFESGNEDAFIIRPDGIRMRFPGRYVAFYNFLAPAGNSVSTVLSLALNGAEVFASRTLAEPAAETAAAAASGQALLDVSPGDKLTLNTSAALEIPSGAGSGPIATLIVYRIE